MEEEEEEEEKKERAQKVRSELQTQLINTSHTTASPKPSSYFGDHAQAVETLLACRRPATYIPFFRAKGVAEPA